MRMKTVDREVLGGKCLQITLMKKITTMNGKMSGQRELRKGDI